MPDILESNSNGTLPAILCFHGHGTNSVIFRYQIRHITQALDKTFRFIFLDAPFEVQHAGPGAGPAFADARPFRRWQSDEAVAAAFGVSKDQVDSERQQVRELIHKALLQAKESNANGSESGPGAEAEGVVGVIAFSQGSRIAAGMCLDPELGARLQFAVLICGLVPPAPLGASDATTRASSADAFGLEEKKGVEKQGQAQVRSELVSIHIHGTQDPWRVQSEKLIDTYFNRERAQVFTFEGSHEVPGDVSVAADVTRGILQAWGGTRGSRDKDGCNSPV